MQTVRLEITYPSTTLITVLVPDEFDPALLRRPCYAEAIAKAIVEATDGIPIGSMTRMDPLRVDRIEVLNAPAAVHELATYPSFDLTTVLREADGQDARRYAELLNARHKKPQEPQSQHDTTP